jgi:hypothetical protein
VIENDLDPNQALILANQNQPKAIKPYDLSRALAPLIDIEAKNWHPSIRRSMKTDRMMRHHRPFSLSLSRLKLKAI